MPSVPRYGVPQVEQSARAKVRVNTEAPIESFGGGQAAANLSRATIGAIDAIAEAKDDADKTLAKDAFYRAKVKRNTLTYGDTATKQPGYLTAEGKEAILTTDKYRDEYLKYGEELEGSLNSDNQKLYFRELFNQEAASFDQDLKKHTFVETKKYQDNVSKALTEKYVEDAILNYNDLGRVQKSMLDQEGEIRASESKRLPQASVDMLVKESHSKTHLGVIRRYMNTNDDVTAKKYFEANKNDMMADHRDVLEKEIYVSNVKGESQRYATTISSKYPDNLTAAVKEAKSTISDPDIQDATVARIKDNYSLKESAEKEHVENLHIAATDTIDKTGRYEDIDPQIIAQFSLADRKALQAYAKDKSSNNQQTDWNDYYYLMDLAANPKTKKQFIDIPLNTKYRSKLADPEFKELVKLRKDILDGSDSATKLLDGYRTDASIVDGALRGMGFNPNTSNKENLEKQNRFRRMVDERLIQFQQRTGKKATNTETQAIVDKLSIEVITEKNMIFPDETKRMFELAPDKVKDIQLEDIVVPKDDREYIESVLKKNGEPINDKTVKDWYLKWRGGFSGG